MFPWLLCFQQMQADGQQRREISASFGVPNEAEQNSADNRRERAYRRAKRPVPSPCSARRRHPASSPPNILLAAARRPAKLRPRRRRSPASRLAINPGGNGALSLGQAEQALTGTSATTSPQQFIANAFAQLDTNADGSLSQSELATVRSRCSRAIRCTVSGPPPPSPPSRHGGRERRPTRRRRRPRPPARPRWSSSSDDEDERVDIDRSPTASAVPAATPAADREADLNGERGGFQRLDPTDVLASALEQHTGTGRYDDAERLYPPGAGDAIQSDPTALYLYGLMAFETGRAEQAAELFETVVALRPDHAEAQTTLARLRHWKGEHPAAIAGYRRAAALDATCAGRGRSASPTRSASVATSPPRSRLGRARVVAISSIASARACPRRGPVRGRRVGARRLTPIAPRSTSILASTATPTAPGPGSAGRWVSSAEPALVEVMRGARSPSPTPCRGLVLRAALRPAGAGPAERRRSHGRSSGPRRSIPAAPRPSSPSATPTPRPSAPRRRSAA